MRIRKIALVVGLSIGLFATSQLLFAQTVNLIEVFGCRGDDTLEAGQFSGSKAVPSGETDSDPLTADRQFRIMCENKTAPFSDTAKVTAEVIYYDLVAEAPPKLKLDGAGTGIANQFYEGSVTLSGVLKNIGTNAISALDTNFANQFQYRPKGAQSWNWLATKFLTNQSADFLAGDSNTRPVGEHSWTAEVGEWEFRLCADTSKNIQEPTGADYIDILNTGNNCSATLSVSIIKQLQARVDLTVNVLPSGNDDQADTITASYATRHILRWKGINVASGTCTLTDVASGQQLISGGAAENLTGVAVGPLVNEKNDYRIKCEAAANAEPKEPTDSVAIGTASPTVSCAAFPPSAQVNDTIDWTAFPAPATYPSGTKIPYTFTWSDLTPTYEIQGGGTLNSNPLVVKYKDAGDKAAGVFLSAPGGRNAFALCQQKTTVVALPDLTANTPRPDGVSTGIAGEFYEGAFKLLGSLNNGGDADIPGIDANFANTYEYRLKGNTTWNFLAQVYLKDQSSAVTRTAPRDVQDFSWTAGPGVWEFQLVADTRTTIKEKSEDNNTSGILTVTIKKRDDPLSGVSLTCNGGSGTVAVENPGTCQLAWSAQNAASCAASANPTNANWNGGLSPTSAGSNVSSPINANTTFTITCKPLPGALSQTPLLASVTAVPFSAACSGSPNPQTIGNTVTWKADAAKLATGNAYTYLWSGSDGLTGSAASAQKSYDSVATPTKNASVSISTRVNNTPLGPKKSPDCSVTVTAPDLTANTPTMTGSLTGTTNQFYAGQVTISGVLNNGGTANIPAVDTSFANQFFYRPKGVASWTYLATTFLADQSTDFIKGTSKPVQSPPSWEAGVGDWEFQLCADTSRNITEPPGADYIDSVSRGNNCSATPLAVKIIARPPGPQAEIMFNNQKLAATVGQGGGGYLTWKCAEAASAAVSGAPQGSNFSGNVPLEHSGTGYHSGALSAKTTFTIECTPKQGSLFGPAKAQVTVLPFTPFCSVAPTAAVIGQAITWSGGANAINNSYSYEWSGDVGGLDASVTLPQGYATVGTKTGTLTVSSSVNVSGQTFTFPKTATCTLPVSGADLAASLSISGYQTGNANELYADKTTLIGSVTNKGSAVAPGDLPNLYLYSVTGSGEGSWSDWLQASLSDTRSPLAPNESRPVLKNEWVPSPGYPWYFRLCADQAANSSSGYASNAGVVMEIDENNNCAQIGPYRFVERPKAPAASLSFNGSTVNPQTTLYNTGGYLTWSCQNSSAAVASGAPSGSSFAGSVPVSHSGTGYYSGNLAEVTTFKLTCMPLSGSLAPAQSAEITVVPFSPTCVVPAQSKLGEPVLWSGSANPSIGGPYTYAWSGDVAGIDQSATATYTTTGAKNATVAVSKTVSVAGQPTTFRKSASCSTNVRGPNLTANTPTLAGTPAGAANTFYAGSVTISGSVNNRADSTDSIPASATGFTNRFEYRAKGVSTWTLLTTTNLLDGTAFAQGETNRAVKTFTWTGGPGDWEFRLIADSKNDIIEASEDDNVSGVLSISIKGVPPVAATLFFNGKTGTSVVEYQGGGYLTWTSQNAASCVASASPADSRWSGDVGLSKSDTSSYFSLVAQKTTLTLTCKSIAGSIGGEAVSSVTVIPFSLSCSGTDGTLVTPVSWSAKPLPAPDANNPYAYTWSGGDGFTDTRQSFSTQYASVGTKTASVTATRTDGSGAVKTASCGAEVLAPDLTASLVLKDKNGTALPPGTYWGGENYTLSGTVSNADGNASAPGTFSSIYHYASSNVVGDDWVQTWLDSSADLLKGMSRLANPYTWKLESVTPYYFSFCADEDMGASGYAGPGAIKEKNESNNCATIGPYTFPPRSVASVDLTIDNKLVGGGGSITVDYATAHTLRWTSANTASCSSQEFVTDKERNNTAGVSTGVLVNASYTYTITCNALSGALIPSVTDTVTVNVTQLPDLTSSLTLSGTKPIAGEADTYYDDGTLTLGGSVTNTGSAATANGTFYNLYQYRIGTDVWQDIEAVGLTTAGAVQANNVARPVQALSALKPSGTSDGITYTYRLCADQAMHEGLDKSYTAASGSVTEYNAQGTAESEESNCSAKTITMKSFPDLTIAGLPAPVQSGALTQGGAYTFTGTVKNAGMYQAGASKSRFQLFLSTGAGGGTVTLPNVSASNLSSLDQNASRSVTSGNWASAVAGKHTLVLCADEPNNDVRESDETNNCSPSKGVVGASTISVYPTAVGLTATKGICPVNGRVTLSFSGGAGAERYQLYRAKDSDSGHTLVEEAATLSGQHGLRVTDDGLVLGATYYYYVKAIGPDGLEVNSTHKSAEASSGCTAQGPDLVATTVGANGELRAGTSLTFSGVVKNAGSQDITGQSFLNRFTLTPTAGSSFSPITLPGLNTGDANAQTLTSSSWVAQVGTYNIQFCADTTDAIDELDDSPASNCKDTDFTVTSGASAFSATLSPDKNDQVAPMTDVALTAQVTGTATGAIGYDFDYGNSTAHVVKTNLSATTYTTSGSERRTYAVAGKYVARVDVTRGGLGASDTEDIRVRPKLTLSSGPACKSITASWEPVNGVATTGYTLSRSDTQNGTYTSLTSSGTSATSYADTSVAAGTTYFYKLLATLSDGSTLESDRLSQQSSASCPQGQQRTLTVSVTGSGAVRTTAGEINCGSSGSGRTLCSAIYRRGTAVTLNAEKASAVAVAWGANCSGAGGALSCELTMDNDRTATAAFTSTLPSPTLSCFPSPNPATVGSAVTWTATPTGGAAPYTVLWTADNELTAGCSGFSCRQTSAGGNPVSFTINEGYGTAGAKNGRANTTDSNGQSSGETNCTALTVNPVGGFNYSLSAQNVSIGLDTTKTTTATRELIQGPTEGVTLQVASIRDPSGTTVTGSSSSLESGNGNSRLTVTITSDITANPTASSAIDVRTRSATPLGNYLVTLRGVSGIPAKTAEFTVTVGAGGGTTPLPVFEEF